MLLKRYGHIDYVLSMDIEVGIEQINKVLEKENEERSWEMYLARYANMTQENYVSFDDFYRPKRVMPQQSEKTKEEILNDTEEILAAFRRGGG